MHCQCTDYALDGTFQKCKRPAVSGRRCARHGPGGTSPRFPIVEDDALVPEESAFYMVKSCVQRCLRILPKGGRCQNVSSLFPYCPMCTAIRERVRPCVRDGLLALVAFDEISTPVFRQDDIITDATHLCDVPGPVRELHQWKYEGADVVFSPPDQGIRIDAARWMDVSRKRPTLFYAFRNSTFLNLTSINARMVGTALVATRDIHHGEQVIARGPIIPVRLDKDIAFFKKDLLWMRRPSRITALEPWLQRLYTMGCTTGTLEFENIRLKGNGKDALMLLQERVGDPKDSRLAAWAFILLCKESVPSMPKTPDALATWCVGMASDGLERLWIPTSPDVWGEADAMLAGDIVDRLLGAPLGRLRILQTSFQDSFLPRSSRIMHRAILSVLLHSLEDILLGGQSPRDVGRRCIRRVALILGSLW